MPPPSLPDVAKLHQPKQEGTRRSRDWRAAAVIAVVALVPRLVIAAATPAAGQIYDMAEYWGRANFIWEHGRIYPDSGRMPAYPTVLAFAFAFADGPSLFAARVLNAFGGTAAAVLTFFLARRSIHLRAAILAGLIVALYPSFVVYTAFIATETLVTVPLLACLIACTYRSRRAACIAALCAAVATLVRPAGVALLPTVLFTFLRSEPDRRFDLSRPVLAAAVFVLAMSPWWTHNIGLHGRFVPFDMSGGFTIAAGNHAGASGTYRWREAGPMLASYVPGMDVWTLAGSERAIQMAMRFIREHPGTFVRLIPAKLAALFALEGREHAFVYSMGYFGPRSTTTIKAWALALWISFPLLACAALAGLAVKNGISSRVLIPSLLFAVMTMLMHVLSFGDPRYHLPLVPLLAVMVTGLFRAANGFSRARASIAAAIVALLMTAWYSQLATYSSTLHRLSQPDGWHSHLSYDDLL